MRQLNGLHHTNHRHFGGFLVQEQEIELSIGDTIQVGQHFLTILDIKNGRVRLQIEHESDVRKVNISGFEEIDEVLRN